MANYESYFRSIFGTDDYSNILQLTDAKLKTEDGCSFDVHRVILSRKTDYFRALFCGIRTDRREALIPGISGECLGEVLCYLYTDQISLSDRNVIDVMVAADYLLVESLFEEVQIYVRNRISIDNCIPLILHAHQINRICVYKHAFRFIETNFDAVLQNNKPLLAELPLKVLKQFLCSRSLNIPDERSLWLAIAEWVQKDIKSRLCHTSDLLMHLATGEIDDNLAKEIMSHGIVKNNSYYNISNVSSCRVSIGILENFLRTHSSGFKSISKRIPPKLHVIAKCMTRNYYMEYSEIYVTHDENLDLWRKIAEIDFYPHHMTSIRQNVFLFDTFNNICLNLNLRENSSIQVSAFGTHSKVHSAIRHERLIYVLLTNYSRVFDFLVLVHEGNYLRSILPGFKAQYCKAASVSGDIYVVGCMMNLSKMFAQAYHAKSRAWSLLPSPKVFRLHFAFVAYHEKLFVIGGNDKNTTLQTVEIFDPNIKKWSEAQKLPISYNEPKAIVLNDRLIVYENNNDNVQGKKINIIWNEFEECWNDQDETDPLKDLHLYQFCELDDVELIKYLSKGKRYSDTELQRSDFY